MTDADVNLGGPLELATPDSEVHTPLGLRKFVPTCDDIVRCDCFDTGGQGLRELLIFIFESELQRIGAFHAA